MRKLLFLQFVVLMSVSAIYSQNSSEKIKETPIQKHALNCLVENHIKGEDYSFGNRSIGELGIICYVDSCVLLLIHESEGELEVIQVDFLEKDLSEGKCKIRVISENGNVKNLVKDSHLGLEGYFYAAIKEYKHLYTTFPLTISFNYKNREYVYILTCNIKEQKKYRR
ncbi:MAG: hypothetical protein KID00_16810 [Clostridium argentinense]|nr:hypothetical protein [Clostridium argentinense]